MQGHIQIENKSIQTLWAPKKKFAKMKKRKSKQWASLCSVQKNILYS